MDLIPLKLVAAELGLSPGYVRSLCRGRRIPGAIFDGRRWLLPSGARVILRASALYRAPAGEEGPVDTPEARRAALVDARMRILAAALAAPDTPPPADATDDVPDPGPILHDGSVQRSPR